MVSTIKCAFVGSARCTTETSRNGGDALSLLEPGLFRCVIVISLLALYRRNLAVKGGKMYE